MDWQALLQRIPQALELPYLEFSGDKPLVLLEGTYFAQFGSDIIQRGSGKIQLVWDDGPELLFNWEADEESDQKPLSQLSLQAIRVSESEPSLSLLVTRWQVHPTYNASGRLHEFKSNWTEPTSRLVSLLANFPELEGSNIRRNQEYWPGRVEFEVDSTWRITIDQLHQARRVADKLPFQRNRLTHALEIRRVDGANFVPSSCDALLDSLHWLLSFSRAGHSMAFCQISFDQAGNIVGTRAVSGRVRKLGHPHGCLVQRRAANGAILREGLLAGWTAFQANNWPMLNFMISCYLSSVEGPLEQRIVLCQMAFEEWFRALGLPDSPAWPNLEAKLTEFGIDLQVPDHLVALRSYQLQCQQNSCNTGPKVITQVRNKLIHGKSGKLPRSPDSENLLLETWLLSLRYLELTILALIGYNGRYNDSTVWNDGMGEAWKPVPWASPTAAPPPKPNAPTPA